MPEKKEVNLIDLVFVKRTTHFRDKLYINDAPGLQFLEACANVRTSTTGHNTYSSYKKIKRVTVTGWGMGNVEPEIGRMKR